MLDESLRSLLTIGASAGLAAPNSRLLAAKLRMRLLQGGVPQLRPDELKAVADALRKEGEYDQEKATYTVTLPRNDIQVRLKGESSPVSFGLAGWVAFKKTYDGAAVFLMGEMVLREDEVNSVLEAAKQEELHIGAIHNHSFYESPPIFYVHVHALGKPDELAKKFVRAIAKTRLLPANQPKPSIPRKSADKIFDTTALDNIVGAAGTVNGATYKYKVTRNDIQVRDMGTEMTAAIGLITWATFAGTKERSHIIGEIAMLEEQVNPVIAVLQKNNLEIIALHHHVLGEEPRVYFLYFYGKGRSEELAKAFRAAINVLAKKPGKRRK